MRPYWTFKDDLAVIDSILMKWRGIIIPEDLKRQALETLHIHHMDINERVTSLQIYLLG